MRGSGHFTLYCLLSAGLFLLASDASGATATASEAWVIEKEIFSENRVVVRDRSAGKAFGQPYDIAFTTWFEIEGGKIIRQIDYADYAALLRQIQVPE